MSEGKKPKDKYLFWKTQPVTQVDEEVPENEAGAPIDKPKDPEKDIRAEPFNLPPSFEWVDLDINEEQTAKDVYNLLHDNYVEDDDNMFRFDYSVAFLKWALKPPGYRKDWHLGVRVIKTKLLVGFITAIPANIKVYKQKIKMVEINFLCVHKQLRAKRLAPVLIKEITRRVNRTGSFQAVYTAGIYLPSPVAQCRYYHRSLNPQKLISVGFSHKKPRMSMSMTVKLYSLPKSPSTPGIRQLKPGDIPQVYQLVKNYLENYDLAPVFNEEELLHWLTPVEGVIDSFVVEDPQTKQITDLVSFYTISSTVIGNAKYPTLKAAYSFYNVATKTDLKRLMNDALIVAKEKGFDVFNCLNIFENEAFLKDLKFGIGDGTLSYYLFNWRCPQMQPKRVGLVLL
eukprot:TRINITY_DN4140_c0_g1_i2.p1 TRINITY_DN4140_c0_g1~~TRINITY_DN4140_c0_g1_i2.p1  ORF type:complete len:415 (+),score=84.24 TRINITY_DN4140_c0_g1_i2:53-1246(+)